MLSDPNQILSRLADLQQKILHQLISSRSQQNLHEVNRTTPEDTIYNLDLLIEPLLDDFFTHWSKTQPLILIAECLTPNTGRIYPKNHPENEIPIRIIL